MAKEKKEESKETRTVNLFNEISRDELSFRIGGVISSALDNSPGDNTALKKEKLSQMIRKRMEGNGKIQFTSSEITTIINAMKTSGKLNWVVSEVIRIIDPVEYQRVMSDDEENK